MLLQETCKLIKENVEVGFDICSRIKKVLNSLHLDLRGLQCILQDEKI